MQLQRQEAWPGAGPQASNQCPHMDKQKEERARAHTHKHANNTAVCTHNTEWAGWGGGGGWGISFHMKVNPPARGKPD